ncbi:hypothetical protein H6P81_007942 [Aristolochia fimbriata]|uniref:Clp R domain-containing protein n=1 Tax=Aristolochia fimbriata TaxID=158543 RepID=A0AAV7F1Y6_ARIFI|nr:hypothetical protein H6P81_007942 [Aristolochia fimbriata]
MRAGGCAVQQSLTAEAASIVKQAVSLARRRGHAQVTPLHVANTMLASSTGLLRTACLQSHSHPLQCKALELCFNVALNRLPASTSSAGPILGGGGPGIHHHHHHPSLSNALVAAFKRAQAHQRRGSIENQQQPLLAVKVEVEQLIISILDDPSVSRVMKEAGFSSTQVKNNVEQTLISFDNISPSSNTTTKPKETNLLISNTTTTTPTTTTTTTTTSPTTTTDGKVIRSEDVKGVLENLIFNKKRRSTVVVAECLTTAEGVVKGVMDKVDKGGKDVPEELMNVQFVSLPLFSFGHLSKEEVEQRLGEIGCLVKRCSTVGRSSGAVLYLGDLKWAAEYYRASSNSTEQSRSYNYSPVEHMIVELGRLVCGAAPESGASRLWLMGIATYQTYMRCRIGHPSLETIWALHPLTIPVDSLGLSLNPEYSSDQLRSKISSGDGTSSWSLLLDGVEKQLSCCSDCLGKFENEAQNLANSSTSTHDHSAIISSTLPSWLQQYKEENRRLASNDQLDVFQLKELCKKWNSFCSSAHKQNGSERTITFSSISSPSASVSSYDQHYPTSQRVHQKWPVQRRSHHHFWITDIDHEDINYEPNLRMYIPEQREPNLTHATNPNPNSTSSSDTMEMEYLHRFKELNAENLKNLCNALEQKVPWQKDIIPEIASTILQCRSGMVRRKVKVIKTHIETKEDTWLFFQGGDTQGKERLARELANLVFGSHNNFVSIGLSSFSSSRSDSTDEYWRYKRTRAESSCSYFERFADAVNNNPHCVFFMDDIEQVDLCSHMGIKSAMERGRLRNSNGEEVRLFDAIVILSCESFDSRSRVSSPVRQKYSDNEEDKGVVESEKESCSPSVSLDLNLSLEDTDSSSTIPSMDDFELLESVDRRFIFKLPEDFSNGFSGGF